jgi:hypothetical protein
MPFSCSIINGSADEDVRLSSAWHAQALLLKARTLRVHAPDRLPQLAGSALELLRSRPGSRSALAAAAEVLSSAAAAAPEDNQLLSEEQLLVRMSNCFPSPSSQNHLKAWYGCQVRLPGA